MHPESCPFVALEKPGVIANEVGNHVRLRCPKDYSKEVLCERKISMALKVIWHTIPGIQKEAADEKGAAHSIHFMN